MKQIYITLVTLFLTVTLFAQGIAVQGIARDNNRAALPQKVLNFTFKIVSEGGAQRYTEDASIRTDNFGVFSHILGTGTKLNNVNFSEQGLKIEVSILYPTKVVVYNESFNYTPYAHYAKQATNATNAANGVPTGSIMPYMGTTAPDGWLLCDGRDIPSEYTDLRAMFSNNKTPNLIGRFLKGAGTGGGHNALSVYNTDETTLGQYQAQSMQDHRHENGDLRTNADGAHVHIIPHRNTGTPAAIDSSGGATEWGEQRSSDLNGSNHSKYTKNGDGSHSHNMSGNVGNAIKSTSSRSETSFSTSLEETKPNNFSVNYIIKL